MEHNDKNATLMVREAEESGAAVARFLRENGDTLHTLGERLRADPPAVVVTCARGSSDHAATYGKYLLETMVGVPVSSSAMSVASVFDARIASVRPNDGICIAISQSGRSPDLLATVEANKRAGRTVIALVNDTSSPLATTADVVLPLCAGPERSVAATKSCITAMVGMAAIAAHWARDEGLLAGLADMSDGLDRAAALDWFPATAMLTSARNLFVIGRGCGYGVALEAALKLKETCALHAEAFSAAEVRHGPMTIVDAGFPILAFATSDASGESVRAVVGEFRERGAAIALADAGREGGILPAFPAHWAVEPIMMLASFYQTANTLSLARGMNPDSPPHLAKVTRTL